MDDALLLLGGAGGILAFILTLVKVLSQDKGWKSLLAAQGAELIETRAAKVAAETKLATAEGEVIALRRELHADRWVGFDKAASASQQQSDKLDGLKTGQEEIHGLVDGRLTLALKGTLNVLRVLLDEVREKAGDDPTPEQAERIGGFEAQIAELEAEITQKDAADGTRTP